MLCIFTGRALVHCNTSSDVCMYVCCIKVDALLVNKEKVAGRDWLHVPTAKRF